ncbi:MAG: ribosome small subunit-dependent GTPase A [SAR202 cluster bacterium]|nr:ribosome small subunit-dependent GTPase A [SAR202 cluster bacterium]MDP6714819.1 ribosome small subunit-dependent GTPase A [SAR202 cluster bacterium]
MTFKKDLPPEHARKVQDHQKNTAKGQRRKQLAKESEASKRFRRGGRGRRRRVRRKDWTDEAFRNEDELNHDTLERVMSRDEHDRRREVEKAVLQTDSHQRQQAVSNATTATGQQGLVISAAGLKARVLLDGAEVDCTVRGILTEIETGFINPVAVGDQALVTEDGANGWVIEEILPRQTILARPDSFLAPKQQVIAANVDLLLIVSAWWNPAIWLELIDRYLVVAQRTGIEPIICVNKVDLLTDEEDYEETVQPYLNLGQRVLRTSATEGVGVDELREALRDRTTAVVGLSGTGKSSLLSAVQPDLKLRTGEVSGINGQGQHTTTQSTLLKLDVGGYVADTPGIKEFGLGGLTRIELQDYFPDIMAFASGCRFSNCSHITEPDCAVQEAELAGLLPESRAHSYGLIWEELSE